MKVHDVVTRESMERDEEEKVISIKWIITSRGTEEHPIAKARLVAREFRTMLADVKTACLYGDARRSLCVDMPPEDPLAASGRHVGKLERAMYGTQDAPMIWQDHLRKTHLT